MKNPVLPSSCVTPAGTSNELDVQNGCEENTHNTHTVLQVIYLECDGALASRSNGVNREGTVYRACGYCLLGNIRGVKSRKWRPYVASTSREY